VGDVKQGRLLAAMQVLGHDAAFAAGGEVAFEVVLHRHVVAGEGDHAGTVMAVPFRERGCL